MKVMINLGTADVEMQRSDGTWEKVQHCRTHVSVDAAVLKVELAAVLIGKGLDEVRECVSSFGGSTTPRSVRPEMVTTGVEIKPNSRMVRPEPPTPPKTSKPSVSFAPKWLRGIFKVK